MGSAIADLIPLSLGIAANPIPIIMAVLLLQSPRARVNGPAFLLSWLIGLHILAAIALVIISTGESATDDEGRAIGAIIRLLLGLLLLYFAAQKWGKRPKPGEVADLPGWMASIDAFGPGKTMGLGLLFTIVNPKHIAFTVAAMISIAQAEVTTGAAIALLVTFTGLSSLGVAIPVIYALVGGDRARERLGGWKEWLIANNAAILAVLFLIFGVLLLSKGLGDLLG